MLGAQDFTTVHGEEPGLEFFDLSIVLLVIVAYVQAVYGILLYVQQV
mgnify:CR=1 FL=1